MAAGGIAAVVFDLDGVLIESERLWTSVREELTRERGGRWREDAPERMSGMSSHEWAGYMREELGLPMEADEISAAVVERLERAYRERLPLMPGARETVARLHRRWPLALASSANRPLIDLALELAGLASSFEASVSAEEVENGKPAPDVYLEAASRLGVPAERCAAIEDSSSGIRAANAAGMRVIAIPNRDLPPEPESVALADLTIDAVVELTPDMIECLAA